MTSVLPLPLEPVTQNPILLSKNFLHKFPPVIPNTIAENDRKLPAFTPTKKNLVMDQPNTVESPTLKIVPGRLSKTSTTTNSPSTPPSFISKTAKSVPNNIKRGKQIATRGHTKIRHRTENPTKVPSLIKPNRFKIMNDRKFVLPIQNNFKEKETFNSKPQIKFVNERITTSPPRQNENRDVFTKNVRTTVSTTEKPESLKTSVDPPDNKVSNSKRNKKPEGSRENRGKQVNQRTEKIMHGKDDHHGKDMDPRYHAFHSWLYRPAPRPRRRGRRSSGPREVGRTTLSSRSRRAVAASSVMLHVGGGLTVADDVAYGGRPGTGIPANYMQAIVEEVLSNSADSDMDANASSIIHIKNESMTEEFQRKEQNIVYVFPTVDKGYTGAPIIFAACVSLLLLTCIAVSILYKVKHVKKKTSLQI